MISADAQTDKRGKRKAFLGQAVRALARAAAGKKLGKEGLGTRLLQYQ